MNWEDNDVVASQIEEWMGQRENRNKVRSVLLADALRGYASGIYIMPERDPALAIRDVTHNLEQMIQKWHDEDTKEIERQARIIKILSSTFPA